jgi:hypothetical protein
MSKKRRAPISQLREAGKFAQKLLIDKGIQSEKNIISDILNSKEAPLLPGRHSSYIPHMWTIDSSQRMLYDFLIIWKDNCKGSKFRQENITEFWKFIVKELRMQIEKANQEIVDMPKILRKVKVVPVLKDIFSPMQKKDTMKAMQKFFIDSFAIAVVLKSHNSVSEYANWFLDWSQELKKLWLPKEKREQIKHV